MAYLTVAEADAYWAARGNTVWQPLSQEAKEAAIVKAMQYIDAKYSFIGRLAERDQKNAWPRTNAIIDTGNYDGVRIGDDEIPIFVKDATAELALYSLSDELEAPQTRGGRVRFEKVGEISRSFFSDAPSGRQYPIVERILAPVLTTTSLRRV